MIQYEAAMTNRSSIRKQITLPGKKKIMGKNKLRKKRKGRK